MNRINLDLNEDSMIMFIKDLLSLDDGSTWQHQTMDSTLNINFSGKLYLVQKNIHGWLSASPRQNCFELFANKLSNTHIIRR